MAGESENKEYQRFFKKLGQRIRLLRLEREMVQEDMLEHGFATRHYQRIEGGLPINIKTAIRICKSFKISLSELFRDM